MRQLQVQKQTWKTVKHQSLRTTISICANYHPLEHALVHYSAVSLPALRPSCLGRSSAGPAPRSSITHPITTIVLRQSLYPAFFHLCPALLRFGTWRRQGSSSNDAAGELVGMKLSGAGIVSTSKILRRTLKRSWRVVETVRIV